MRVTVFAEKRSDLCVAYSEGMNEAICNIVRGGGHELVALLEHGSDDDASELLTAEILEKTDVLVWWGHLYHNNVSDAVVELVYQHVNCGMGLLLLHSAHGSKIAKRLWGTTGALSWRNDDRERLWVIDKGHPIAQGVGDYVDIDEEEMYGEPFGIPEPEKLVFISWFAGGEVMRSGAEFHRGLGKIFYFRPGHEGNPTYHNEKVITIVKNAINYLAPVTRRPLSTITCPHVTTSPEQAYKTNK